MSDEPAYIRNFKVHTSSEPTIADLSAVEDELFGANDRAVAIMLSAFLEAALTKYLKSQLRQDLNSEERRAIYDYDGPLGSFSAQIAVSYALSAIGPITRDDMDLIRIIRNGFAHTRKNIKFDDPQTAAICARLQWPDREDATIPVKSFMNSSEPDWDAYSDRTKPQTRYRIAVHSIAAKMLQARARFEMANELLAAHNPPAMP